MKTATLVLAGTLLGGLLLYPYTKQNGENKQPKENTHPTPQDYVFAIINNFQEDVEKKLQNDTSLEGTFTGTNWLYKTCDNTICNLIPETLSLITTIERKQNKSCYHTQMFTRDRKLIHENYGTNIAVELPYRATQGPIIHIANCINTAQKQ